MQHLNWADETGHDALFYTYLNNRRTGKDATKPRTLGLLGHSDPCDKLFQFTLCKIDLDRWHTLESNCFAVWGTTILRIVCFYFGFNWGELFISSPEPKAQVSYCHSAPSVVRPSVRKLSHFLLLLWNHWTEFNETWQEARSQRPLPSLCFSSRSEKQDGRPGLWLAETFSISLLKPLNGIQRNLTGSKISKPSTKFVFFGPIWKTRWPPWPLIGWDIFDFSSETAEPNSTKLYRKQDLKALYQVCVFRADRKSKMAALASDWLRHFRLLWRNRWTEFNETWQEARSQRPLPSLCFSGRSKKQDGHLDSDWLRHFRLLLWNRWMEFNETWQEARSQRPQPSLCFSGLSEKQDGRPGLWLAEIFSTSPLKPLNGIQRNLIGSKISTPSTKFVFFRADRKNRMAALASDWLRHFRFLWRNRWTEFNET